VLIQVHDELCNTVPDRKIAYDIAEIMRNAVKLRVPVKVDVGFGDNWGDSD
jgi:DNA polymerase-1